MEIKFRGMDVKTKEWVYGNLVQVRDTFSILNINFLPEISLPTFKFIEVKPETIGQYIGLKDKNNKEIYYRDIVECCHWFFDGNEVEEHFIASVGFINGSFTLENIKSKYYSDYTGEELGKGVCWIGDINFDSDNYKIVGNISENPELLNE